MPGQPVRVAVDVLGHDADPGAVLTGVLTAVREDPGLSTVLVGPADLLREQVRRHHRAIADRVAYAPADDVVGMAEDPVLAVRTQPRCTVRVAAGLVRTGDAQAMVSVGSTGAALAAASSALGRTSGLRRPALLVTIPTPAGPLALLDVGATLRAAPATMLEHATAGAAYARASYGIQRPRVGLLSVGAEDGKGDAVRRTVHELLTVSELRFGGNVEGGDVALGGRADVVLTDGFTGNVLLKGLEGSLALVGRLVGDEPALAASMRRRLVHLQPDRVSGAVVLGVEGTVVIGHGASSAGAVACCVRLAADTVRSGVLAAVRAAVAPSAPSEATR